MIKPILFFLTIVFLTSCIKDSTTNIKAFYTNPTQHNVQIIPFIQGVMNVNNIMTLSPNSTLKIADYNEMGMKNGGGFHSDLTAGADSIIVVFDATYRVTHYYTSPVNFANNYYTFDSNRNIRNISSFIYKTEDTSESSRQNTYKYTFTEEDYLYAKSK